MSSESKTVAGAYARIDGHEELCAERYDRIHDTLSDLKESQKELRKGQEGHQRAAWGIVMALIAWMGIQLWDGIPHQQRTSSTTVVSTVKQ